ARRRVTSLPFHRAPGGPTLRSNSDGKYQGRLLLVQASEQKQLQKINREEMKIGVIETGNIGGTLAGKLSAADTISASRIREVRKGSGLWPTTSARSHF